MEPNLPPDFHDQQAIHEWRELGFYYDYNGYNKVWLIVASPEGLLNLIKILNDYSEQNAYAGVSEHLHIGPSSYLKLVTWNKAQIVKDGIYGQQNDFARLAEIIARQLDGLPRDRNWFVVDKEFGECNEAVLRFVVIRDDAFDPSVFDVSIGLGE